MHSLLMILEDAFDNTIIIDSVLQERLKLKSELRKIAYSRDSSQTSNTFVHLDQIVPIDHFNDRDDATVYIPYRPVQSIAHILRRVKYIDRTPTRMSNLMYRGGKNDVWSTNNTMMYEEGDDNHIETFRNGYVTYSRGELTVKMYKRDDISSYNRDDTDHFLLNHHVNKLNPPSINKRRHLKLVPQRFGVEGVSCAQQVKRCSSATVTTIYHDYIIRDDVLSIKFDGLQCRSDEDHRYSVKTLMEFGDRLTRLKSIEFHNSNVNWTNILQNMANCPSLASMYMIGCRGILPLANVSIRHGMNLKIISLCKCKLDDNKLEKICSVIRHHINLEEIHLDGNAIALTKVPIFMQMIVSMHNLQIVSLEHNRINQYSMNNISTLLRGNLTGLYLSRNFLGCGMFSDILSSSIDNMVGLSSLRLDACNLSFEDGVTIIKLLTDKRCEMVELSIMDNRKITMDQVNTIFDSIHSISQMRLLRVPYKPRGHGTLLVSASSSLCELCERDTNIDTIGLQIDNIGSGGGKIATKMQYNPTIVRHYPELLHIENSLFVKTIYVVRNSTSEVPSSRLQLQYADDEKRNNKIKDRLVQKRAVTDDQYYRTQLSSVVNVLTWLTYIMVEDPIAEPDTPMITNKSSSTLTCTNDSVHDKNRERKRIFPIGSTRTPRYTKRRKM